MDWSETLQATHRGLSEQDLAFREAARRSPEMLRRETFRLLAEEKDFIQGTLQPWPTFLGREKLAELSRVSLGLADLLRSLPERVFGNDPAKVSAFYGLEDPETIALFLSRPNGFDTALARGDLIDTEDGFQCIEFNFTPNLGGWETSAIAGLHLRVPATAGYLERAGIAAATTATGRRLFVHLIETAKPRGLCPDGDLNVALVVPSQLPVDPDAPAVVLLNQELQQAFQDTEGPEGRLSGELMACHFDELEAVRNYLFLRKSRIHAVVEFCDEPTPPSVFRSFKAEKLALFNGPVRAILSSKTNVALLSESQESGPFSPEERDFIRRHVPWTRRVAPGETDFRGERIPFADLLAGQRDELVLKEARSAGGQDVAIGKFTSEERWSELSRHALEEGGWVVQQRVESLPYLYQCGDEGCAPHDLIWGPFVFGRQYGGVILRMQPKSVQGAVNSALGATSGIVFEV